VARREQEIFKRSVHAIAQQAANTNKGPRRADGRPAPHGWKRRSKGERTYIEGFLEGIRRPCYEAVLDSEELSGGREASMKASRLLLASIIACLLIFGSVSPAAAKQPKRGCPPPFEGPLTFTELLADFPPPPEIPLDDILAALDSFDANDDGLLCVFGLPGDEINAIDNVANVPD
jgi:hypothetical protein